MAPARPPETRQRLRLVHLPEDRRLGTAGGAVHPLLLWIGVLGGPLAFGLVRLAGLLLITGSCRHATGSAAVQGLSSSQVILAAITVLGALLAASSGLLSWRLWRRVRRYSEDQSGESMRPAPFWALGGVFLGSVFFVAVLLTGGLALGLGATCVT